MLNCMPDYLEKPLGNDFLWRFHIHFLEDVETQQPNKFLGPTSLVKDKYLEYLQAQIITVSHKWILVLEQNDALMICGADDAW